MSYEDRAGQTIGVQGYGGRWLGIDASLTSAGFAFVSHPSLVTWTLKPKTTGVERLDWYRQMVTQIIEESRPDGIMIEDYAYSRANQAHQIGELGGVLRMVYLDSKVPVWSISTGGLKKFVTGYGGGDKTPMSLNLFKKWGVTVEQNDEVDATGLALALAYLKNPDGARLVTQRDALEKVNQVLLPGPRVRTR